MPQEMMDAPGNKKGIDNSPNCVIETHGHRLGIRSHLQHALGARMHAINPPERNSPGECLKKMHSQGQDVGESLTIKSPRNSEISVSSSRP